MYKSTIIEAIQNQKILKIHWQKETTKEYSECLIAPYDVYPKSKKNIYGERDILLGLEYETSGLQDHTASIYLDSIQSVVATGENFNGNEVRRIINPKNPPMVLRNW